mgnify:FL=1
MRTKASLKISYPEVAIIVKICADEYILGIFMVHVYVGQLATTYLGHSVQHMTR